VDCKIVYVSVVAHNCMMALHRHSFKNHALKISEFAFHKGKVFSKDGIFSPVQL